MKLPVIMLAVLAVSAIANPIAKKGLVIVKSEAAPADLPLEKGASVEIVTASNVEQSDVTDSTTEEVDIQLNEENELRNNELIDVVDENTAAVDPQSNEGNQLRNVELNEDVAENTQDSAAIGVEVSPVTIQFNGKIFVDTPSDNETMEAQVTEEIGLVASNVVKKPVLQEVTGIEPEKQEETIQISIKNAAGEETQSDDALQPVTLEPEVSESTSGHEVDVVTEVIRLNIDSNRLETANEGVSEDGNSARSSLVVDGSNVMSENVIETTTSYVSRDDDEQIVETTEQQNSHKVEDEEFTETTELSFRNEEVELVNEDNIESTTEVFVEISTHNSAEDSESVTQNAPSQFRSEIIENEAQDEKTIDIEQLSTTTPSVEEVELTQTTEYDAITGKEDATDESSDLTEHEKVDETASVTAESIASRGNEGLNGTEKGEEVESDSESTTPSVRNITDDVASEKTKDNVETSEHVTTDEPLQYRSEKLDNESQDQETIIENSHDDAGNNDVKTNETVPITFDDTEEDSSDKGEPLDETFEKTTNVPVEKENNEHLEDFSDSSAPIVVKKIVSNADKPIDPQDTTHLDEITDSNYINIETEVVTSTNSPHIETNDSGEGTRIEKQKSVLGLKEDETYWLRMQGRLKQTNKLVLQR